MIVNLGAIEDISLSDSGCSSTVIFLRECPLKCKWCHNEHLQKGYTPVDIDDITRKIDKNRLFISMVVFSGGEPTSQLNVLEGIARYCKDIGLKVAVETSGYNPEALKKLFRNNLVDQVFLDCKTVPEKYAEFTGNKNAFRNLLASMEMCSWYKIPTQVRTTVFDNEPTKEDIGRIKKLVEFFGFDFKKQKGYKR